MPLKLECLSWPSETLLSPPILKLRKLGCTCNQLLSMHFSCIELKIRASSKKVPGSPGEKVLSSVEMVRSALCCLFSKELIGSSWGLPWPGRSSGFTLPTGWGCSKTKSRPSGWAPRQWSELANWTWSMWEALGFRAKFIAVLSLVWPGCLVSQMIGLSGLIWVSEVCFCLTE